MTDQHGDPALLPDARLGARRVAEAVVERERLALDRLEERERAWQIHPSFEDEAQAVDRRAGRPCPRQEPGRVGTHRRSRRVTTGRLPRQVVTDVVTDAFRGLAEVHEAGLVHRGLYPRDASSSAAACG